MNSTATRIESRPAIDAVRGEFFCVGEGRRVDSRSPWPGAGGSHFRISAPRRRGKSLPNQTASASLGGLAWVPFVHGVSTEVLAARLPRRVHGRDRSPEIFRFPEAPNGTQAELFSVGIANFFRYLNSYKALCETCWSPISAEKLQLSHILRHNWILSAQRLTGFLMLPSWALRESHWTN